MSRRALLLVNLIAAALAAPSTAVAASATPSSSNLCLDSTLSVTSMAGVGPVANAVVATVVAQGTSGLRISRLHLDIELQERTATAWVPFVTTQHAVTYTNYPGSHLHRVWTLREAADPVYALLGVGVQMRVYAKFVGSCRGPSLGGPLLFGLTAPTVPPPSSS
jgi:hypothetical protein